MLRHPRVQTDRSATRGPFSRILRELSRSALEILVRARGRELVAAMLTTVCLAIAAGQAGADQAADSDASTSEQEAKAWSASLGLSYLATSGNSDTQTVGIDVVTKWRPEPWGLKVKAQAHREDQQSMTVVERYFLSLRGTRSLTERWDAFVGLSSEQNEFASIDHRVIFEAGGTIKTLTGPRHQLRIDIGLTWTEEARLAPEPDISSLGGLAGFEYELAISETATFSQDLAYHSNFDNSADWRLESLTALSAALNQRLALQLSFEVRYRGEPIGENEDTDTSTKASLVFRF